jgi:hypothetical protein
MLAPVRMRENNKRKFDPPSSSNEKEKKGTNFTTLGTKNYIPLISTL